MLQLAHLQVLSEQDKPVMRAWILRVSVSLLASCHSQVVEGQRLVYLSPEDQILNDGFLESAVQKKGI